MFDDDERAARVFAYGVGTADKDDVAGNGNGKANFDELWTNADCPRRKWMYIEPVLHDAAHITVA